MALETLKDVAVIGGFGVGLIAKDGGQSTANDFIYVDHESNTIKFTIQNGAIKENGVNGCQVDTIIETATRIIKGLNKKFPCRENSLAITKLEEALMWLEERTKDREKRNVEGTEQL